MERCFTPLIVTNCDIPSSIHNHESSVFHHELDLFNDTLVVCGFSKCQGFKDNPFYVTLTHYICDQ